MAEQIQESGFVETDDDICGSVSNLASALNSLEDIDIMLYDEEKMEMFKEMKDRIFKSLYYYTSFLPDQDS